MSTGDSLSPKSPPITIDNKESKHDDVYQWMSELYFNLPSKEEISSMYESYKYEGFDRMEVLKLCKEFQEKYSRKILIELILVSVLRGPIRASETKLSNGRSPTMMGVPASGLKGGKGLSCARISASLADYAAYMLKQTPFKKRVNCDCPAWLQFPGAAAIDMPDSFRKMHKEFSKKFSKLIKPKNVDEDQYEQQQEQIYDQQVSNCYYDDNLSLF
jgi:hypothetical protein